MAPILQGGINVDVPQADVDPIIQDDEPIVISITDEGRLYLEETEFTLAEFDRAFPDLAEAGAFERVYIQADSLSDWGVVLPAFAVVQRAGVNAAFVGTYLGAGQR